MPRKTRGYAQRRAEVFRGSLAAYVRDRKAWDRDSEQNLLRIKMTIHYNEASI